LFHLFKQNREKVREEPRIGKGEEEEEEEEEFYTIWVFFAFPENRVSDQRTAASMKITVTLNAKIKHN
jgi:hypothetical protein